MSMMSQEVGNRIRTFRKEKGFSQELLAEKADLHPTYISMIERGLKNISMDTMERVLGALDVSFPEFFQCMEIVDGEPSYAERCYDLVRKQNTAEQARMYHILWEIDQLMEASRLGLTAK